MRRTRRRGAKSDDTSTKTSSDDSDHQKTMNIIDKMSKKLMGPGNRTSRALDRKDRNQQNVSKKCSTPLPRSTRTRSKSRRDTAYEADVDSTTSTATSSDGSTDMYDFDQSNEQDLCLVLFPTSTKKTSSANKTRSRPGRTCTKQNAAKKSISTVSQKMKSPQRLSILKTSNENTKPVNTSSAKKAEPKNRETTKRKKSPSENSAPVSKKSLSQISNSSMFDSGVFMSPIERVPDTSLSTPNLTPIPTPSLSLSEISGDQRIPNLQFDSLLEEPLDLSPVKTPPKKPNVQPMDLGSPPLKTPIAEKTYGHRGLFQSPAEKLEKKKKAPAKQRVTSKRVDAWATQMNAEFNEIEMYDLSIEDQ